MRVERLPDMLSTVVSSDDGLGGYRDTEALGVFHPPARSRFEQAVADQMAEAVRAPREYFEAFPGLGHMAALTQEIARR